MNPDFSSPRLARFARYFTATATVLAATFGASAAHADAGAQHEVVIAYQDMVVPWRYAQATGAVEKATGYKVTYRKLASGADVIRALASGSVQLGEAGSSPIAANSEWKVVMIQATAIMIGHSRLSNQLIGAGLLETQCVAAATTERWCAWRSRTGGTSSTPPRLHGLQRSSRQAASALPRSRPCRPIATTAYCEHDG